MDRGTAAFPHVPLARAEVEREERHQVLRMVVFAASLGVALILAYLGYNDIQHRQSYREALILPLGLYVGFLNAYTQRKKDISALSLSELREIEDLGKANPAIGEALARWRSVGDVLRKRDLAACKGYAGKMGQAAKLSDMKWD
ncbi:hypothetical protein [Dyella humicola]|uniref:hypothetical protein n=1 Tax=Dyella humicola TaxID=2992126 RepID=UPI002256394A|nr:hypothetical protein [Dyella humicola]